MERPRHFEDYAIGEQRRTHGRTITETDFVVHAGHTGDFFPHHMDAEHMKTSAFGQRIAHGTMTFAIGIGLTAGSFLQKSSPLSRDKSTCSSSRVGKVLGRSATWIIRV